MPKGVLVLLLDSALVPQRDRVELITTVMSAASEASVVLERYPEVHARMDLWQLGRLQLFRSESSGIAMTCSRGHARRSEVPIVALAVQERSRARHEQFDHQQEIAPGALMAVDLTAAFAFSWRTRGASRALQIPISELDLPTDVIRSAIPRIGASPMARLVTTHIVDLFRDAIPSVVIPARSTSATPASRSPALSSPPPRAPPASPARSTTRRSCRRCANTSGRTCAIPTSRAGPSRRRTTSRSDTCTTCSRMPT